MKKLFLTIVLLFGVIGVFAQAQYIKTVSFYKAYVDVPIVKKAVLLNGSISRDMVEYLLDANNPADIKYALVNALGLQKIDKLALIPYNNMIMERSNNEMSVSTEMSFLYLDILMAGDELYVDLEPFMTRVSNYEDLNQLEDKLRSTTIIYSLINAQYIYNENYCGGSPMALGDYAGEMWKKIKEGSDPLKNVLHNNPSGFKNDIRPKAIEMIWNGVKDYCE